MSVKDDLLLAEERKIEELKLREKFMIRKALVDSKFTLATGAIQKEIKACEEWAKFLKEVK